MYEYSGGRPHVLPVPAGGGPHPVPPEGAVPVLLRQGGYGSTLQLPPQLPGCLQGPHQATDTLPGRGYNYTTFFIFLLNSNVFVKFCDSLMYLVKHFLEVYLLKLRKFVQKGSNHYVNRTFYDFIPVSTFFHRFERKLEICLT